MDEFDKFQQVVKEHDDIRARTGPASWAWKGPARNIVDYGYKAGQSALRRVAGSRWWPIDRRCAIELAGTGTASVRVGRHFPQVIPEFAKVIPGWMQTERPSADAGVLEPIPKDPLGREIANPWMEPKDIRSQVLLTNASPRLAAWLKKCAQHGGAPSAQMLVEFEIEREEAEQMRRVCDSYNDKLWAENRLRRDNDLWPDGFNLTEQMQWVKSVENKDKWLIRLHRAEAKAGPLRLHFDDPLTIRSLLAKRDPQLAEIHKLAAEIVAQWEAEGEAAA